MPPSRFRAACATRSALLLVVLLAPAMAAPPPARADHDPNVTVDPTLLQSLRFRMVGPTRGGRVTALAGHRRQRGTFYMGATGGGVWKTTDFGLTWSNVSDGYFSTGSIGAIALAESDPDTVYVGTGSAAIRSNVIQGRGVYRSRDAGKTWTFVGLREAGQIGALRVHPQNPDVAYVAALGQPFGPNPERGVFRTTDGGASWKKVLYVNDRVGVVSLAMNPSDPRELYAGAWRGERRPWTIVSGGPSSQVGLYKSTDGGDTWKHLSEDLPTGLIGKVSVDVSRANPKRVYLLLEAPGDDRGVYRSDDGGETFEHVNSSLDLIRRPFYYTYITADPKDADTVYVNNEGFFKSTDGGRTFKRLRTPHGDNHGMWINPDDPDLFIQSNDGGANVTTNGGRTWSTQMNQPTAELYQVDVDDQVPYRIYGAQQDTGWPLIVPSLPPQAGGFVDPLQLWTTGPGCETGPVKPKPGSPHIVYGVCKGEISRLDLRTGQEAHYWVYPQDRYGQAPRDIVYRFQRVSPFEFSPHDPDVIYHGSHVLHRTRDGGVTWEVISPDLTANDPAKQGFSGEPITRDITGEEVYSAIYAVRESPLEPGLIWVGANDGPVHVTRDGGRTWTNVTPAELPPGGRVQNIEPSPHRKGSAYLAVYRYLLNDWQPYIFRTDDYGQTWKRLTTGSNGIPDDFPTRVVREDPEHEGLLYAGTEFGLFASFDNGAHWQSLQLNLPVSPVTDLRVHRGDLVVSTMGRSFWVLDNVSPLRELASTGAEGHRGTGDGALARGRSRVASGATTEPRLLPPREAYRIRYQPSSGANAGVEYPPPGAQVDYVLARAPQGPLEIEILDATGTVIRRVSTDASAPESGAEEDRDEMGAPGRARGGAAPPTRKVGLNRWTWDLRHEGRVGRHAGAARRGPIAVPGTYRVRLSVDGRSATQPLVLKIDPRLEAAGVTQRDLEDQLRLQLELLQAIGEALDAAARLNEARERMREASGYGTALNAIETLQDRLVTDTGVYPQRMLIDQLSNVYRMIGQADQKVGRDAFERYRDLRKELDEILVGVGGVTK
jgi:hypothetical protein